AGGIWIGNRDVTYVAPKDRDVAMVFQNYALYPYLTVAQNIGFPLKIAGLPKRVRDARVEDVARRLGLEDYLERKPGHVSGGARRSSVGRASPEGTSRCRISTRSSGCRCAPTSPRSSRTSGSRPST